MSRRLALLAAGLATCWVVATCGHPRRTVRNVVLISIDTLRADHLGAYGFARAATPNLDALAHAGVLFENVHTPVPMTLPAHVSMLTGTLPPTHGLRDNLLNRLPDGSATLARSLAAKGLRTGAVVSSFVLDRRFGTSQGFDSYDDRFQAVHKIGDLSERKGGETARVAGEWLDAHKRAPFFLFVHFYDPHDPYEPPEPFASQWRDDPYAGEVAFVDRCVGQVLDKLRALGLYDDTLIVLTGDHGEMLGEHGELNHGFFIYEGALRVPLIMRPPGGLPAPRRVALPVSLIDIMPTILAQAGAAVPPGVQGLDLSPWLAGRGGDGGPRTLYAETVTPTRYYGASSLLGVIDNGWKYIETSRPELYDLRADPGEKVNLLQRDPARADALSQALVKMLAAGGRAPASKPASLDTEARERLEALGYLGRGDGAQAPGFDRSKDDPKDLIGFFRKDQRLNKLVEEKQYPEARALCAEMLHERPGFADCHLQMSKIAAAAGNLDAALRAAQQAVAVGPQNVRAQLQLAGVFAARGENTAAVVHFRAALALEPDSPETRLLLGHALAANGQADEAARLLGTASSDVPEDARAATELGFVLAKQGKLAEAVAAYRRALALDPDAPEANAYLGSALAAQAQWDEALPPLQRALAARPDNAELHDRLGVALREKGRSEEALAHFEAAVRLAPGLASAHYNLARARKQQGRLDEAAGHYRRAFTLDPQLAAAHNGLGSVLGAQGRMAAAAAEFRAALRLAPDDAEAHNNLGLALRTEGQREAAVVQFEAALRLRPEWAVPMNETAWILATHDNPKVRNPARALTLAEGAAQQSGRREPVILDTLAAAYAANSQFERAAAAAAEASALAAANGSAALAADIDKRLALYRRREPFREPAGARR